MKFLATLLALLALVSCRPRTESATTGAPDSAFPNDTPILKANDGDCWEYRVVSEVHKADGSVDRREGSRSRTFLGQREPIPGKGRFDTFQVAEDGKPLELEFVAIKPDSITLHGSQSLRDPQALPALLSQGVPFVRAGLRGGEDLPLIQLGDNAQDPDAAKVTRKIRVIGREQVQTTAGSFEAIRLLMTGVEGPFELRRTIWFAPGDGIVMEHKERYAKTKLLVSEQHELVAIKRSAK